MGPEPKGGKGRPPLSAIVTTYNEEHNIGACLESLLWCDEIVVVDSYSTDGTPEIARSYDKVRFYQRRYYGSASQKNWAMDHAQHEWILIFDADERCTPALQKEIERLLREGANNEAYIIKRRAYFMGRVIRFSGWQHDRVVRLLKKQAGRYPNRRVHADMETRVRPSVLRHPMEHYMIKSFDDYYPRILKYSVWGAAQGWREGRRVGLLEVFGHPVWRFLRTYLLQLGILDGMHGLVFCMLQAFGTYMKYAVLWGWRRNAERGYMPELPAFDEDTGVWRWEGEGSGVESPESRIGSPESRA